MAEPATLLIGATGMLGRPVAACLARQGFPLRALARDRERAQALLPAGCDVRTGDVRDEASLAAALDGMEAVYMNLSPPRSPRAPDPEHEGVPRVVAAARRAGGVRRLARISFMGVEEARGAWWQADRKAESDRALMESGLAYTVFRPTWFMESLTLLRRGRRLLLPGTPPLPLYWIAGDDYGRQVAEALRSERAANRVYTVQGPEPVTFSEAGRRFAAAAAPPLRVTRLPGWLTTALAPVSTDARYARDLLRVTFRTNTAFLADGTWEDLGRPRMTVEDYAASLAAG